MIVWCESLSKHEVFEFNEKAVFNASWDIYVFTEGTHTLQHFLPDPVPEGCYNQKDLIHYESSEHYAQ